jgi:hypothetical protein
MQVQRTRERVHAGWASLAGDRRERMKPMLKQFLDN